MFVVNAVNYDPYGMWTALKMVLMLLNINNLHCPTIRSVTNALKC